jgi:uncharacterized membrane protein YfcA
VSAPLVFLGVVVAFAFAVEATLGFGATVITVALGSIVVSTAEILPAFVPLNLFVSMFLLVRGRHAVDGRILLWTVLPPMAIGLPIGIVVFRSVDEHVLRAALGVFVTAVSVLELRRGSVAARTLPRVAAFLLLLLGGIVHGAFATGGPLIVYVLGRALADDKARFRATLSVIWLVSNAVLIAGYLQAGKLGRTSLSWTAAFALPLLVGLVVGERLHHRVPAASFRRGVFALLLVAGVVLLVRAVLPVVRGV